jgi:hypothetical protein
MEIVIRTHTHYLTSKGRKVSVVCNANGYCEPRDDKGPYTAVEIGLWSTPPDYLVEYADGYGDANYIPEGRLTIYPYVPVNLLGRLLAE